MINKARRNKKESLCEKSMKLVVSIVKLSSLNLATLSIRTPVKPPASGRNHVPPSGKVAAMAKLPSGSQISLEEEGGSKPEKDKSKSTCMIPKLDDINIRASDFIRRIREKNRNDLHNETKDFPYAAGESIRQKLGCISLES